MAIFDGCEIVEHTNAEEGYGRLCDKEIVVDVVNPCCGEAIWMEFGNEYAVGIGGWRVHYGSCEVDYRQLKDDIAAILSGEMRFLAAFAGDGDFLALAREGS